MLSLFPQSPGGPIPQIPGEPVSPTLPKIYVRRCLLGKLRASFKASRKLVWAFTWQDLGFLPSFPKFAFGSNIGNFWEHSLHLIVVAIHISGIYL